MEGKRKFWLVFVNVLTISRIIGSIFLFHVYSLYGTKVVGLILAFLFATDWIDGYLARKYKVSTFFGSIMDAICDKMLMIVACTILCFLNPYMVCAIVTEVIIMLTSAFNVTQNNTAKTPYIGKFKMWVLSMCVILGFFFCKPEREFVNLIIFIPAILFEIITLSIYLSNLFSNKIVVVNKKPSYKSSKDIRMMLFSPEFYEQNKDKKGLLNNIYEKENKKG